MEGVEGIRRFLTNLGISKLMDISKWHPEGRNKWIGWDIPECPPNLEEEKVRLLHFLNGKAPLAKRLKDVRGWGSKSGQYSVADGYKSIKAVPNVPRNPTIWNYIWTTKFLPKVDHFA